MPQIQEQIEEVAIVIPKESFSWCASSEINHKRDHHFVWFRKSNFLDKTRVLSSAGMTFLTGQSLGGCPS